MNASRPALPEPSLAAWSRTARPVRAVATAAPLSHLARTDAGTTDHRNTDQLDDLLFGCSAAVLMAMPLIIATATLVGG